MESHDDFELASQRARKLQASLPKAISAHYDRRIGRIVIRLNSKLDVAFSPRDAEGLEDASPAQLDPIEISPSGFGIHFPKLDADLYLPALLEGFLGSKSGWRADSAQWVANPEAQRKLLRQKRMVAWVEGQKRKNPLPSNQQLYRNGADGPARPLNRPSPGLPQCTRRRSSAPWRY